MKEFGLLIGHLIGDYILQDDWQAANKTNPHPGKEPHPNQIWLSSGVVKHGSTDTQSIVQQRAWWAARDAWWRGHAACTVHCFLYTLAVVLCSFWWMPWWGPIVCFAAHWPIDRFRLARLWMIHVTNQKAFATGALSPWSVIVVDNVFHLLTLFLIGAAA